MESQEIIQKVLESETYTVKKMRKSDGDLFKQIKKYLVDGGLKFKSSVIENKIPIWNRAGKFLDQNSIVLNIGTEMIKYDTMSYFQKYHGHSRYYIFHGKYAELPCDVNQNFFHWTECYPNMVSVQGYSKDLIEANINSIQEKEKIKLIHFGESVEPDKLKYMLSLFDEIVRKNNPYILFEEFLDPYDVEKSSGKFLLNDKKFNLFESKKFRVFKDYINEKSINFEIVCSALPNDSSILLKIKAP